MNIYKNQGGLMLIKKGRGFIKYHFDRLPTNKRTLTTDRALREEYDYISNPVFQITSLDVKKSNDAVSVPMTRKIKTANWFVPNFDHIKFGGIYTIFRFIEKLSIEGIENRIIIYDNPSFDVDKLKEQISDNFVNLKKYKIIIFDMNHDGVNSLPASDLSFCTFWTSAYIMLRFNKTKRKYYFVQDYEPLFYAGGSTYALAESTYRFGFRGLVNTPGLLAAVNKRHGMKGISFVPAVDQSIYYPSNIKKADNEKVRIFFYARPNNPRNAFNLGILIIKSLIEKYGDKIEIVTAGAHWNEKEYELTGKINNLGLLGSLQEVADLYRSCDIGFVYMLSKHPSYQPFEFMASGMATVTNNNEDNLWLLRDGKNCLLSEPSPAAMAEKIGMLIDDKKLRVKISKNGHNSLGYTWPQQTDMIWNDIRNN
ncbi:MAG: glycosyltransferase [Candidatus Saccharibacteria bacterium]